MVIDWTKFQAVMVAIEKSVEANGSLLEVMISSENGFYWKSKEFTVSDRTYLTSKDFLYVPTQLSLMVSIRTEGNSEFAKFAEIASTDVQKSSRPGKVQVLYFDQSGRLKEIK